MSNDNTPTLEKDNKSEEQAVEVKTKQSTPSKLAKEKQADFKALANEESPSMSPVDLLYNEFSKVFGNSNQRQLFSLVWPGTVLNYDNFKVPENTVGPIPKTVHIAQSLLFDKYYPVSPITQPDGTRVSDRYKAAIESYAPIPNERLIELQRIIRERLDQKVEVEINGVSKMVSLLEKFTILQENWISKKIKWGKLKSEEYARLKKDGNADWWEQYITWYESNAEGYIEDINAAYNRMIADFPMTEFEDALAILDSHDGASLLRAKQEIRNAAVTIPPEVGSSYYVTNAVPIDWGSTIKPSVTFRDLLASPEAQQHYLDICVEQLQQQIFAWNSVLAQISDKSKSEIEKALDSFNNASKQYFEKSNQLISTYADNTVLAVKTYMEYIQGSADDKVKGANKQIDKLNSQSDSQQKGEHVNIEKFNEIADKIVSAQKQLIDDTGSMVACGQELGNQATAYLNTKAGEGLRAIIMPVLNQLNSQLDLTIKQVQNFRSSAGRTITLDMDDLDGEKAAEYDSNFSSTTDALTNQRWSEITLTVKSDSMKTASETSTSFSQSNWGVDFFFGSAGGQSVEASEKFQSEFMDNSSEIQIGMLATKVIIERPWMHPEVFSMTKGYFKAIDSDIVIPKGVNVGSSELISKNLGGTVDRKVAADNCDKVNKGIFPSYPVALLLVKDVTIKLKCLASKTSALQSHSESNSSNGGGFLCFSVSKTQSSSADNKSVNSYCMGGDYVFKIPAPQIVGVWNQLLPTDESKYLNSDDMQRILKFKVHDNVLKQVSSIKPYKEVPPVNEFK